MALGTRKVRNINSFTKTTSYNTTYHRGRRQVVRNINTRHVVGDERNRSVLLYSESRTRNFYNNPLSFYKSDEAKGFFTQFFAVIVILLLAVTVIRVGRGYSLNDSMPTFESFLKTVVSAPVISPTLDIIPTNLGTWVISFDFLGSSISISFDFLRIFVESFLSIVNFLLWLVQNLFLVLQYLFYFLRWVFQM